MFMCYEDLIRQLRAYKWNTNCSE